MDLFVARIEREQQAAQRRAEELRRMVPHLAAHLYGLGATKVILFGSLVRPDLAPHERTDVDLCAFGLSADQALDASFALTRMVCSHPAINAKVDVVSWDDSSDRLKRWVSDYGQEVQRVTE